MVTTAVLIVHDGAKMAQQELDKNGLWGRNLNILKVTVAYVEKMVVKMMVKMMVSTDHNILNVYIHRNPIGKGFHIFFILVYSSIKLSFNVGCTDTPSWNNGHGYDCNSYGTRWCKNGAAKAGQEWTLGAKFKYPENNCCVCGKGNSNNNLRDLNCVIFLDFICIAFRVN